MHAPLLHLHCTKVKLIKEVNVILKVICIPLNALLHIKSV